MLSSRFGSSRNSAHFLFLNNMEGIVTKKIILSLKTLNYNNLDNNSHM